MSDPITPTSQLSAPYAQDAPGYPAQPGPGYPAPAPRRGNPLAVSGFVIALVGFLLCLIPIVNIFAIVLAVVGLILAILGLVKAGRGAPYKGLAIAGIVLAVLGGVGGGVSAVVYAAAADAAIQELDDVSADLDKMSGDATEDVLSNDVSVELGGFEATTDEYGLVTTSMSVTMTNTADEKQSYLVTVEAVDGDGNRVADDIAMVNDLAPGQSQTVEIFQLVTEDQVDALKAATFQIADASAI